MFQKGPPTPARPLWFSSASFKETEQWYLAWEKGVLSITRVVKDAKKLCTLQGVTVQGPFPFLNSILNGSPSPRGVAQKATVRKGYAYLEGISQLPPLEEGPLKASSL